MAIFNRINKNSGLVVGVVVVALAFFLLGEALMGSDSLLNRNKQDVGEISGKSIPLQEYQYELQRQEYEYQIRSGKSMTENERPFVQDQAWNKLVFRYAYKDQFDKLGLIVTDKEWEDMTIGENIHPMVKSLFGNPDDFEPKMVQEFHANLGKMEPEVRNYYKEIWSYVDRSLPEVRIREKYANLLKNSLYVTTAEAKREHTAQNAKYNANYLYVPTFSVADSLIQVTDADLKGYINRHQEKYKVEESRSLEYVAFSITPSEEDSLAINRELAEIAEDFTNSSQDSIFVYANSDNPVAPKFKNISELPGALSDKVSEIKTGKVYGPFNEEGNYFLYKVTEIGKDTINSARASHILFKPEGESAEDKRKALQEAKDVLNQIKKGADFAEMARKYGTDATATRGGDLGWFNEKRMVKPFSDAVFKATSAGLLPIVETEFGYHIIKVTEPKTNKKYKVATVEREVTFSEKSREAVFQKASDFAIAAKDTASFRKLAKENNDMTIYSNNSLKKTDRNVNTLMNAREIVRWAYTDAEVNQVSNVFHIDNQFIVAVLKDKREEGISNLEDVRDEVTAKVKDEKKAEYIISKLKGLDGDLNTIAEKYGRDARSGKAEGVTLNSNSIKGIGYDPIATGVLVGLKEGQRSKAFKGENGVIILELISSTPAPEIADFTDYGTQIKKKYINRQESQIDESIKKYAEVKDERFMFY